MGLLVRIDGVTVRDRAEAKISIFDHGFLFGDSVYEVIRTYGGRPFDIDAHVRRLFRSADGISLAIGRSSEEMKSEIDRAIRDWGGTGDAYVRIIVTRGVGEIDINPDTCARPTTLFIVKELKPWPAESYERGIDVAIVSTVRNGVGTVDPSIKTGNYLNSVLALIDARRRGAAEACMLNARGELTECTTSNIFFVRGSALLTPSLESGILSGITRSEVIRLAREAGLDCCEGTFSAHDLKAASEAFITSTTRGVMPIARVDGRAVGAPGRRPVTARVSELFAAEVERFVAAAAGRG